MPLHPPSAARQRVVPVQQRSRLKIETILDATSRLLVSHGLEHVTMLVIAEEAGLAPATVYHYFESRLAIFAALVERTMTQVDDILAQHLTDFADSQAVSSAPLLTYLHAAYRQAPGYVQLLQVLSAEPSLRSIVQASNQRIAQVLADMLVRRAQLTSERAARIAWIISESCEQVLQEALLIPDDQADLLMQELVEMVDVLFEHYCE